MKNEFCLAEHVEITFKPKTKKRKVQGVIWHIRDSEEDGLVYVVSLKSGQLIKIRPEWGIMRSLARPLQEGDPPVTPSRLAP